MSRLQRSPSQFEIEFPLAVEILFVTLSVGWGWVSTLLFTERALRPVRAIEEALAVDLQISDYLTIIEPYREFVGFAAGLSALFFLRAWLWRRLQFD
jgi:hypothetical protein